MSPIPNRRCLLAFAALASVAFCSEAYAQAIKSADPGAAAAPSATPVAATATPVAAPHPSAVAAPTPSVTAYRINPGDQLEIYTWGEQRLQREVLVLPDGTFAFPLVGQIMAQGRLPQEIEAIIISRLQSQYRGEVPQVTVSVKSPSGLQFSVMGKVRSPGTFTPGRYLTVVEALSLAGGPAEFANLDDVLLLRKHGTSMTATRIKLGGLFRGGGGTGVGEASQMSIQTGDTLIVP